MLYMTTRNSQREPLSGKALTTDFAADNGLYIPSNLPVFSAQELLALTEQGCCNVMAHILNLFFDTQLTGWDIESCLGKAPIRLASPGRKIELVETSHNPGGSYSYATRELNALLIGEKGCRPHNWAAVAILIAYSFGAYTLLKDSKSLLPGETFDVCVRAGDFSEAAAITYSRKMGLPIGKVIIATKENNAVWNLINHWEFATNLLRPEQQSGLERLICDTYGQEETEKYVSACARHGVYILPAEQERFLSDSMFAAVIGRERIDSIRANVFSTCGYQLDQDAAICYGGIQDYRAKTGQGNLAVLLGHNTVVNDVN